MNTSDLILALRSCGLLVNINDSEHLKGKYDS
jgi:hypothetical protein